MLSEPIKVGVIGVGRFGENHVRAYKESPFSQLVAVADLDDNRTRIVAEKYGITKHYSDYRSLLDHPEIQAVSIATPAPSHADLAITAAKAGKHILLEKPIAMSLSEAEEVIRAAHESRVKLLIGHLFRFEANFAAVQSALVEGTMGQPLAVISRLNNPITEARYAGTHISPILHVMIHLVDLSLWYMNRTPTRVFCQAAKGKVHEEMNVPDGCIITIEFEEGGLAVIESFWCLPENFANWTTPRSWTPLISDTQLEVICTQGVFYLDTPITRLRACDNEGWKFPQTHLRSTIRGELSGAFREEVNHFLRCCVAEQEPLVGGREALNALRVALAAEASLAAKMPVPLISDFS